MTPEVYNEIDYRAFRSEDLNCGLNELLNMHDVLGSVMWMGVPGDVVEIGCNRGRTSVYLTRVIKDHVVQQLNAGRYEVTTPQLHVYDSFQGLPPGGEKDEGTDTNVCRGGLLACTAADVLESFHQRGCPTLPTIHKGWFADTLPTQLPDKIAFALLDGDWYDSILVSLEHVWPRLSPGGVIIVDDYDFPKIPGARRATDDFCDRMFLPIHQPNCCVHANIWKHNETQVASG